MVMYDEPLEKWQFADSVILDIPQNAQWWTNNIQPPVREYLEHFLKDVGKEAPVEIAEEEAVENKDFLKDEIKNEKISRKLFNNTKRKRPGIKEGVRSLE